MSGYYAVCSRSLSRGMISRELGNTGLAVDALRLLQRRGGVAVLRQASESMLALRKVKTSSSATSGYVQGRYRVG